MPSNKDKNINEVCDVILHLRYINHLLVYRINLWKYIFVSAKWNILYDSLTKPFEHSVLKYFSDNLYVIVVLSAEISISMDIQITYYLSSIFQTHRKYKRSKITNKTYRICQLFNIYIIYLKGSTIN